jgi:uridine kinase
MSVPPPDTDIPPWIVVIGVAGGTASGKTTLVDEITSLAGEDSVAVVRQDSYYRDLEGLDLEARQATNYDHPDAIEFELLTEHVRALSRGEGAEVPQYDFKTHARIPETIPVPARKVVVVEGILVLAVPELRELMDLKIFVDTDHDLRLIRRLRRDIEERGRTFDSVTQRYLEHVRPMHREYVEPSKEHADLVVPHGGFNQTVIALLTNLIEVRNLDRRRRPRGPSRLF